MRLKNARLLAVGIPLLCLVLAGIIGSTTGRLNNGLIPGDWGPFTVTGIDTATMNPGSIGSDELAVGAVLRTFVLNRDPVSGADACDTGEIWWNTVGQRLWECQDGATDLWKLSSAPITMDTASVTDLVTPCGVAGESHLDTDGLFNNLALCINATTEDWAFFTSHPMQSYTLRVTPVGLDAGIASSGYDSFVFKHGRISEIIGVDCITVGGTSATITLEERTSTGGAGNVTEPNIVCDADGGSHSGAIDDANVDNGDWGYVDITATSGNVSSLLVVVRYRPQ